MKTTLKRGIGRSGNGDGGPVLPPDPTGPMAVYRQPPPPRRGTASLILSVLGWAALCLAVVVTGAAGGVYLYTHESVAAVAPESEEVKQAIKKLDLPLPGQPATALVIGYDRRAEEGKDAPSRSDTLMLVRADPNRKTLSLLSFPRDLQVEIRCPDSAPYVDRINAAYSRCGVEGSLRTVQGATGTPINYLITVNFRGFRQIVDKLGGIWLDIDRRYFNDNTGPNGYARINLNPGYQQLNGYQALDYVRYRHTDSDLFRVERQQRFVRSLKEQLQSSFSVSTMPKLVRAITRNVEVGQGGGKNVDAKTVLSYALLAYSLPPGHVFQSRIEGIDGFNELTASTDSIRAAIQRFNNPDVDSPRKATAVALGEKLKQKVPLPKQTAVTVLNGNGVTGSASNASFLLGQRGYQLLTPPGGVPANAPTFDYFRTSVYFDRRKPGAQAAARRVASLFGSADTAPLPAKLRTLAGSALLTVVVGQTFHGRLATAAVDETPERQAPYVTPGASASSDLLRERRTRIDFPLMVPTAIERSSWIDREKPIHMYRIDPDEKHKAVRLVYRTGGGEYWGVQMTDWDDAPALEGKSLSRRIGGRRYELHYDGPKLRMVVLRTDGASYWVVNTLRNSMSNETMLAIAKGLKPLATVKR